MSCVTCTNCGSVKQPKQTPDGEMCADCGLEAGGFPMNETVHLEQLRFFCKTFPQKKPKRRGLGVPRETGKTTVCVRGFSLWQVAHDKNQTQLYDAERKSVV